MRTIVCLGILVATSCSPARAQLLLHPGEAYTYQFPSLPLFQAATPLDSPPGGYWELQTAPISPATPLRFRLEMFEDSLAQPPIGAVIYESSPEQPAWDAFTCISDSSYNWQDLQGAVRVTVLEGTLQLNSLWVTAWRPAGEGVDDLFYSGPIAIVPEPSALSLLILSSCMLCVWIIFKEKRRMAGALSRCLNYALPQMQNGNFRPRGSNDAAMRCSKPGHRAMVGIHASRGPSSLVARRH